ncbi:HIT family protein [Plantibacter sp. T3]|uniref:HIT family protein n=1 Tax=Plantibacter sp. T3 TaxID=2653161 RepID=UPI0012F1447F|nr:HIT family protein [Plantibacter sp. T3]VXB60095.1 Histidine triad (HIT) family protein [Plantibacter sp. T3]
MNADDACDFCTNIAEGTFDVVARATGVIAVIDRHPINRGHVLVLPTRHAADLAALHQEEITEMAVVAQRADRAIRNVFGDAVEGTNLLMSNGAAADQGVLHAHLHVIPRATGDGYEFREDASRYPLVPLDAAERAALSSELASPN